MSDSIGIVDIFAGPGGLGEGFSAAGREDGGSMSIRMSVENDRHAFETLRLRAFLRASEGGFPREYYEAIKNGDELPDWAEVHPDEWSKATSETHHMTLGKPATSRKLGPMLDTFREEHHGTTVLIGEPPCQAYSLVGRARNRGIVGYDPADDHRHFLYRSYVRILERLRPAAFVMENVKGMLSSEAGGGPIFARVLNDLSRAGDGYTLVPLTAVREEGPPSPRDFLVRSEKHGVPQARHRVFVVGFRKDMELPTSRPLLSTRENESPRSVMEVIENLPKLRSGLSRGDEDDAWSLEVRCMADIIASMSGANEDIAGYVRNLLKLDLGNGLARVATGECPIFCVTAI